MDFLKEWLGLGLEPKELQLIHVLLRSVVVFFSALIIVRVANKRFLSKLSPLDVILGFVLASMLARAINGSAPLFESMAAGLLLVLLHRMLAALAYRSTFVSKLLKGSPDDLIVDGQVRERALASHNITRDDLLEGLRIGGSVEKPEDVRRATLERDGEISVIKKSGQG